MSREDILAVALRLFAIYLVIGALQLVGQAFATNINISIGSLVLAITLSVVLPLVIAALLWLFPLAIAAKLLPVKDKQHTSISVNTIPVLEVGCILIGLWLLASSISDLTYWVVTLIAAINNEWGLKILPIDDLASMTATVMQIVLSLWLLLGYRGVLKFIQHLRSREISQP